MDCEQIKRVTAAAAAAASTVMMTKLPQRSRLEMQVQVISVVALAAFITDSVRLTVHPFYVYTLYHLNRLIFELEIEIQGHRLRSKL